MGAPALTRVEMKSFVARDAATFDLSGHQANTEIHPMENEICGYHDLQPKHIDQTGLQK